ncbi:hypothetical protein RB593_001638 [Gaeumannomyces tritici]
MSSISQPLGHTWSSTSTLVFIYTIILLCAGIPVPEFKAAVIFLLSTVLGLSFLLWPLVSLIRAPIVVAIMAIVSVGLPAAALVLAVVRWNLALSTADQWAIPNNANLSVIPGGVNPELWVLVHGTRYGVVVIVGAALVFVVSIMVTHMVIKAKGADQRDGSGTKAGRWAK